ncbi:MAG: 2-oxo acid dehydrogenase subunit E2, partial [Novosphingobium sp.]|nr:2-oxo acid dehydrogenase subunit E2 [Novosphingobium sp.]
MGRYTFRLPDIGEGIAEAEIVAWHVKVGDSIEEDGPLADMMTDKATVEMESPVAGTVLEVGGEVGNVVAIGAPLVVLEVEGEGNEGEATVPEPSVTPTLSQGERETMPKPDRRPKKPSPPGRGL